MYTLYYAPGKASMAVHLALLETGAPHRLERVDVKAGAQRGAGFRKLNPRGAVPVLIVDGVPRTESAALLMLLAERHPESQLAPAAGTPERDAWREWIVRFSNGLMPAFRLLAYPRDLGVEEHTPMVRDALQRRIEDAWIELDAHLTGAGPYLLGAECSGADLLLAMLMRWSRHMPRPAGQWPALRRLADRLHARPSWKKLCEIEGLSG